MVIEEKYAIWLMDDKRNKKRFWYATQTYLCAHFWLFKKFNFLYCNSLLMKIKYQQNICKNIDNFMKIRYADYIQRIKNILSKWIKKNHSFLKIPKSSFFNIEFLKLFCYHLSSIKIWKKKSVSFWYIVKCHKI